MDDFSYIENFPFKVNLYGCIGDIYTLRASGWDIFTKVEYSNRCHGIELRICGTHRGNGAKMMSKFMMLDELYGIFEEHSFYEYANNLEIRVQCVAQSIILNNVESIDYSNWNAFTGSSPNLVMMNRKEFNPRKISLFSNSTPDTELILPRQTVDDMLKNILKEQGPMQKKIREERLRIKKKAESGELESADIIEFPKTNGLIQIATI